MNPYYPGLIEIRRIKLIHVNECGATFEALDGGRPTSRSIGHDTEVFYSLEAAKRGAKKSYTKEIKRLTDYVKQLKAYKTSV